MKQIPKKLISLMLIMMLMFGSVFLFPASATEPGATGAIHVLNTGWEDAIILESDGHYALVDAGEPGRGPYIVDYLQRLAGRDTVHLDFIIGTHSHIDHMGGFPYILSHPDITVGMAYAKRETEGSNHYQDFIAGCESNGIPMRLDDLDARVLSLGNMNVTILNGAPLVDGASNQESLCQLVQVGDFKALLAADMVTAEKERGVSQQIGSTVDFLKVGHHGMSDSTGRVFANQIRPKVAVYTNGNSWETDSNDVTLGVKKGLNSYTYLNRVGTAQYVTTDIGGLLVEFGETEMTYQAIKEFTQKGDSLIYETREEVDLREVTPPSLNFFEKIAAFFKNIWYWIAEYFEGLCHSVVTATHSFWDACTLACKNG